jgi:hypothetical protein
MSGSEIDGFYWQTHIKYINESDEDCLILDCPFHDKD